MRTQTTPLTNTELDVLHHRVAADLETLFRESEAHMGHARIVFYALSGHLDQWGIVEALALSAAWMEEQGAQIVDLPAPSRSVN